MNTCTVLLHALLIKEITVIFFANQPIGQLGRMFASGLGNWNLIPGQVIPKTQKMVLDTAFLNTALKGMNQGYNGAIQGGVEPFPTP